MQIKEFLDKLAERLSEAIINKFPFLGGRADIPLTKDERDMIVHEQLNRQKKEHEMGMPQYESPTTELQKEKILISEMPDIEKIQVLASLAVQNKETMFVKIDDQTALRISPQFASNDILEGNPKSVEVSLMTKTDETWEKSETPLAIYPAKRHGRELITADKKMEAGLADYINSRRELIVASVKEQDTEKEQEEEHPIDENKGKDSPENIDNPENEELENPIKEEKIAQESISIFQRDFNFTRELCKIDKENIIHKYSEAKQIGKTTQKDNEKDNVKDNVKKNQKPKTQGNENQHNKKEPMFDKSKLFTADKNITMKFGKHKDMTPEEVIRKFKKKGLEEVKTSREKLLNKVDKYPDNMKIIEAIDEAVYNKAYIDEMYNRELTGKTEEDIIGNLQEHLNKMDICSEYDKIWENINNIRAERDGNSHESPENREEVPKIDESRIEEMSTDYTNTPLPDSVPPFPIPGMYDNRPLQPVDAQPESILQQPQEEMPLPPELATGQDFTDPNNHENDFFNCPEEDIEEPENFTMVESVTEEIHNAEDDFFTNLENTMRNMDRESQNLFEMSHNYRTDLAANDVNENNIPDDMEEDLSL